MWGLLALLLAVGMSGCHRDVDPIGSPEQSPAASTPATLEEWLAQQSSWASASAVQTSDAGGHSKGKTKRATLTATQPLTKERLHEAATSLEATRLEAGAIVTIKDMGKADAPAGEYLILGQKNLNDEFLAVYDSMWGKPGTTVTATSDQYGPEGNTAFTMAFDVAPQHLSTVGPVLSGMALPKGLRYVLRSGSAVLGDYAEPFKAAVPGFVAVAGTVPVVDLDFLTRGSKRAIGGADRSTLVAAWQKFHAASPKSMIGIELNGSVVKNARPDTAWGQAGLDLAGTPGILEIDTERQLHVFTKTADSMKAALAKARTLDTPSYVSDTRCNVTGTGTQLTAQAKLVDLCVDNPFRAAVSLDLTAGTPTFGIYITASTSNEDFARLMRAAGWTGDVRVEVYQQSDGLRRVSFTSTATGKARDVVNDKSVGVDQKKLEAESAALVSAWNATATS